MKSNQQFYNKSFYTKKVMMAAINDYKHIATILLSETGDGYLCSFVKCVVDSNRVIHEFDNYLIELMNAQGENS